MTAAPLPTSRERLRHVYLLIAGKTISDIGSNLDMVALNIYVYMLTGSSLKTGLFMTVRLLGSFSTGFYAGILADRLNRKSLMILSDLVRALALLTLVFAPTSWQLPLLYVAIFIMGGFNSLFGVALQASIPVIAGETHRLRATALMSAWRSAAMIIGLVSASALLALVGYRIAFMLDAASYVVSALVLALLPLQTSEVRTATAESRSFMGEVRDAYRYLALWPALMGLMVIRLMDTFGSAAHNVGMPIFSARLLPSNPAYYVGITWSAWAVGDLLGARWMASRFQQTSVAFNERAFGLSTFFMSAFFILLFTGKSAYSILPVAVLAGVADGVAGIFFNSRLQQIPDEKRGRIFGIAETLQTAGFTVGMVLCSPLFDLLVPAAAVGIMHGVPMVAALLYTLHYRRQWQDA